ncbi:hypothetical protein D1007_57265 [Hordeum vulgare]|nr:hypothetical protein D1007_57265 [Hordeum vulgare]
MTEEVEAELMRFVMEDSISTHNERQWVGLKMALTLSATGDVAIPELKQAAVVKEEVQEEVMDEPPLAAWNPQLVGQQWDWSTTTSEMADTIGVGPWAPMAP